MSLAAEHSRPEEPPRALYEYRGKNRDAALLNSRDLSLLHTDLPVVARSRVAPPCSHCSASTEKVVGGWWCSSCEIAFS